MTEKLELPDKLKRELNNRTVAAAKANSNYAKDKHEDAHQWAATNAVDVNSQVWLYNHAMAGLSARAAIEDFLDLIVEGILPRFINNPEIASLALAEMKRDAKKDEPTVLSKVNEMLRGQGMEPLIVAGDLDEIIEQLQGLRDAEGATKQ